MDISETSVIEQEVSPVGSEVVKRYSQNLFTNITALNTTISLTFQVGGAGAVMSSGVQLQCLF